MEPLIIYFEQLLVAALSLFSQHRSHYDAIREIPRPDHDPLPALCGGERLSFEELVVLLLALMPHYSPQTLDLFFMNNEKLGRPYTEFGGWRGSVHSGFLPTAQTAVFLLAYNDAVRRDALMEILGHQHPFYKNNILRVHSSDESEPPLSGKLCVTEEALAKLAGTTVLDYRSDFPAKRITTPLAWDDLVLPYKLTTELHNVLIWLRYQSQIRSRWQLDRIVKRGYRALFYGPAGTGKTLTATLLGREVGMEVYRVDLSMIVSKYIGETEKNLAQIFDRAENQQWILFFDEADALFGRRTEAQSSNDRHANQEVAYLLQRIEDFSGMVVLATNLKENLDEAFFRRFQSALFFPMPDEYLRYELWRKMIPAQWLGSDGARGEELLHLAAGYPLSGGSMVNVVQSCAINLFGLQVPILTADILVEAIHREQFKEGRITAGQ